jgi:hypothetical protein
MKTGKWLPASRIRRRLVLITLLCCLGFAGRAQIIFGGILDSAIDRAGHKYCLRSIAVNDTVRADTGSVVTNTVASCSSGYFQLFLEPGSGMENSANPTHMARRNVLCRVLYDLSRFIHSPLTASGNKVNVWVRNPASVPGASGLGYATSFFTVPNNPALSGIADNAAWSTIHSGGDAYLNLQPTSFFSHPGNICFHMVAAFDFSSYLWNTNLNAAPATTEFDLYTVVLREMAHALGLSSEIAANGSSLLGANYPYYSRFDQLLAAHSGIPLLANVIDLRVLSVKRIYLRQNKHVIYV